MSDVSLGNKVGQKVLEAYQKLGSSCKPSTRSNGANEWTVLASIVAIDRSSNDFRLISLGTGVKALPDAFLHRSNGKMVHDCHAEILALRAFNAVILHQIAFLNSNPDSEADLVERSHQSQEFSFKSKWELAIYISTLPCGDASMDLLCDDQGIVEMQENDPIQYVDPMVVSIVRGRFNYSKKKVVRTKPGRVDSQITLSKSCSDKLCQRQVISILNCMTWNLLSKPVYLKYFITSNTTEYLHQSFYDRIRSLPNVPLEFLRCSHKFEHDKHSNEEEPCSISSVKLYLFPDSTIEQALLNGLRNGFYTKGTKPLRSNCESVVSRYSQWNLFKTIRPEFSNYSYLQFKETVRDRNKLIQNCRQHLSPKGWISTSRDDCL